MRFLVMATIFVLIEAILSVKTWTSMEQISQRRAVLRLSYRSIPWFGKGKGIPPIKNPYTLGLGQTEDGDILVGRFMGTDWDGCIYFFDPLAEREDGYVLWVLRRFNAQGRLQEEWEPILNPICAPPVDIGVAVTKDGYIWTGVYNSGCTEYDIPGLPVLVYRKGVRNAIMDWRFKVPFEIQDPISKSLAEKGLQWRRENLWFFVRPPQAGPQQVALALLLCNEMEKGVWIVVSSNGKRVLKIEVTDVGALRSKVLSPDGVIWQQDPAFNFQTRWDKVWFVEEGKEREQITPLIDRAKATDTEMDRLLRVDPLSLLTATEPYPPIILRDIQGHLYLLWTRDMKPIWLKMDLKEFWQRYSKRFYVGKEVMEVPPPTLGGVVALVVLDRVGKIVAMLPWRQLTLEGFLEGWVHPMPNGQGFYRIEYREREAVIYFHPLPR